MMRNYLVLWATILSQSLFAQLSGNYTIGGTTPDFSTVQEAVDSLISQGVSGPVIFDIRTGTYIENIVIPNISGTDSTNRITFQSETGDSTDVQISTTANDHVFRLINAHFLTFKSLTVKYDGINIFYTFCLQGKVSNINIENCRIIATANYSRAIYITGSNTGQDSMLIKNNYIEVKHTYAIGLIADGTGVYSTGNEIIGNEIYTWNSGVYITLIKNRDFLIQNNIMGLANPFVWNTGRVIDIDVCVNGQILNNDIYKLDGNGITISFSDSILIANNMISMEGTTGGDGLKIYNTRNVEIVHNSIRTHGTPMVFDETNVNPLCYDNVIKNNIFYNYNSGYVYYFTSNGGTPGCLTTLQLDYNNGYTDGAVFANYLGGNFNTLADFQAGFSLDSNSISILPAFTGVQDLHVSNFDLNSAATPSTSVSVDFDGEIRNPSTPDIGADEFNLPVLEAGLTGLIPNTLACSGIQPLSVIIRNEGQNIIVSAQIGWEVNGVVQTPYSWVGSISTGQSDTATLSNYNFEVDSVYNITTWVTNPNGTTDTFSYNDTVLVLLNVDPAVDLGPDTILCNSIVLDAGSNGATYNWSTGDTTQTITVDSSGSYDVEILSQAGCSSSDTLIITVYPPLSINLTASTNGVCVGDTITLSSGGSGNVTYSWAKKLIWYEPFNYPDGTQLSTRWRIEDVWGNFPVFSCVPIGFFEVRNNRFEGDILCPSPELLWISEEISISGFNNISLSSEVLTPSFTADYTKLYYRLDGGPDVLFYNNTGFGCTSYQGSVSNLNGNTVQFVVKMDKGNNLGCVNWFDDVLITSEVVLLNDSSSTMQVVASTSVYYYVTIEDTVTGCIITDSIYIDVAPSINPVITASGPTDLCSGDSVVLNTENAGSYLWSDGSTDTLLTVYTSGSYYYTLTDSAYGCQFQSDTIIVQFDTLQPSTPIVSGSGILCTGDSVLITSNVSGDLTWFLDGFPIDTTNTDSIWVSSAGWYQVQNSNSCATANSNSLYVDERNPNAEFWVTSNPIELSNSDLLTLSVNSTGTSFFWDFDNGITSTQMTPGITYALNGSYEIMHVAQDSICADTIYQFVQVLDSVSCSFDSTGSITQSGWLNQVRYGHKAYYLPAQNKVIAIGGRYNDFPEVIGASCEVYDLNSSTWTYADSMAAARNEYASVMLPTGEIMVMGGSDNNANAQASCELYDPVIGQWNMLSPMNIARKDFMAFLISGNRILVIGGRTGYATPLKSSEIYDISTDTWSFIDSLEYERHSYGGIELKGGNIFVVGGVASAPFTAEILDVNTLEWRTVEDTLNYNDYAPYFANDMIATMLLDGNVLITGALRRHAEIFNYSNEQFYTRAEADEIIGEQCLLLPNGKIFHYGKGDQFAQPNTGPVNMYDPIADSWSEVSPPSQYIATFGQSQAASVSLPSGDIFIVGGINWVNLLFTETFILSCAQGGVGLTNNSVEKSVLNIFPNPSTGEVTIRFYQSEKNMELSIANTLGQIRFKEQLLGKQNEMTEVTLNETMESGIYFVKITGANHSLVQKLIMQSR